MSSIEFLNLITGGALIGAAAGILLLVNGRIAGVSGIYAETLRGQVGEGGWRIAFLAGLLVTGLFLLLTNYQVQFSVSSLTLAVAGLLVGFGTDMGSGCTSGHGVCGNANLSPRSLVATLTFIASGMLTVFILKHI